MTEGQLLLPTGFHRLWVGPQSRTLGGRQDAMDLGPKRSFMMILNLPLQLSPSWTCVGEGSSEKRKENTESGMEMPALKKELGWGGAVLLRYMLMNELCNFLSGFGVSQTSSNLTTHKSVPM